MLPRDCFNGNINLKVHAHLFAKVHPLVWTSGFVGAVQTLTSSRELISHSVVHIQTEAFGEAPHGTAIRCMNPDGPTISTYFYLVLIWHSIHVQYISIILPSHKMGNLSKDALQSLTGRLISKEVHCHL
jgi:hypothetical protein